MLWAQAEIIDKIKANWMLAAIALGMLFALFVLFKIAAGRKKRHPDLERGQREDLAEYPPPPPAGAKRSSANGMPVRLRLVVVSPTGKAHQPISPDDVPDLLDDVLRGLGGFVRTDKPRVKIWPTQLQHRRLRADVSSARRIARRRQKIVALDQARRSGPNGPPAHPAWPRASGR